MENECFESIYNAKQRKEEVFKRLNEELEYFETLDFTGDQPPPPPNSSKLEKKKTLEGLKSEAEILLETVSQCSFKGQHFTKEYRTLQGHCNKLMQHLDSIDHQENQNVIRKVDDTLETVQRALSILKSKVHRNGECCSNCELYNTKWQ